MSAVASKLEELIAAGWNVSVPAEFGLWRGRVRAFLFHALSPDVANSFERTGASEGWYERRPVLIGMLEALALGDGASSETNEPPGAGARGDSRPHSRRVFVVHGRDTEAKGSAARFIERLGLEPVILHEQPNSGRTVIAKFEAFPDVGFAVVLLTPDDIGAAATESSHLKGRARQNVILELGYFLGRLSRSRVVALYMKDVEIPSDYQGVLYVELDPGGAWRTKIAEEFVEAGFSINLESLLKS